MSGVVGQVANLLGQISNLPHDIAFLSPNSDLPTASRKKESSTAMPW